MSFLIDRVTGPMRVDASFKSGQRSLVRDLHHFETIKLLEIRLF